MPTTTPTSLAVAVAAIADDLRDTLLKPRDLINQAPRDPYTAQLRRSVACGKAMPVHMLLSISMADAEDRRIPIDAVLEPYRQAIEVLAARRAEVQSVGVDAPSLLGVIQREDSREDDENAAERRVLAEPDNPEALEQLLMASATERQAQDTRDESVRRRLGALRRRAAV
jgi:hypothetical protein